MTDTATLTQYLAEAQTALHKVLTGQQVQVVSYDGRSVTYSQTNVASLRAYINDLQFQLGQTSSGRARLRGISVI